MAAPYSGMLLRRYVQGFIEESKADRKGGFNQASIAYLVFHDRINRQRDDDAREKERKRAVQYLSKCLSERPDRHLNPSILRQILAACRELLEFIYKRDRDVPDPKSKVRRFEQSLCGKLKLSSRTAAEPGDFLVEARFDAGFTPEDFGVPDLTEWRQGTAAFIDELQFLQRHGVELLDSVLDRLSFTGDVSRRFDLLSVAFSISALNYPGTRCHQVVRNQAILAAEKAGLFSIAWGRGVAPNLQLRAARLLVYLHALAFLPTLDSPANALRNAYGNRRLQPQEWGKIQDAVTESIAATKRLELIDPESEYTRRTQAAMLSQQARLLASTGVASDLRAAKSIERLASRYAGSLPYPYGLLYPIQSDMLRGRTRAAIAKCEQAINRYEAAGQPDSAAAFAALYLQLSANKGEATADEKILELATRAIASPSVRYQCSHIFEETVVRKLIRAKTRRR